MRNLFASACALLLALPGVAASPLDDATGVLPGDNGVSPPPLPPAPVLPDATRASHAWARADFEPGFAGTEVSGKVLLRGTARAEQGYRLQSVAIHVDRVFVGYATGTSAWSFLLDSARLLDGNHTVAAYALARPELTPLFVQSGTGESIALRTFNHQPGVVLFEKTMDFTGASVEHWTLALERNYTGLRVTLRTEATGEAPAPLAQLVATYKGVKEDGQPSTRTWVATYGALQGSAQVSRAPHDELKAPGLLALHGLVAGQGRFHVKVEAVPA